MDLRPKARLLLACTLGIVAAVLSTAPAASAGPVYPVPDPDGFYAAPDNLGAAAPGDVLRARPVANGRFPGSQVWQLLFRSTDSTGGPIAAVTTLISPGAGPRPLLSYQPFVNSLGLQCAPSHALFDGGLKEAGALNLLLARGWAVSVPDHLGPDSAYGAARMGGQITLDGIRAVQRFAPAGLGNSPVGLAGYSGGAMSTGFAAALAPEYAPELPIVGVAQGGLPVNPGAMAVQIGDHPHPLFGLGFAVAMGLEREYPDALQLDRALTPAGRAMRDRLANSCTDEIISAGAGHSIGEFFTSGMESEFTTISTFHANALEEFAGIPRAPIYQWHGGNDQVPLEPALATAGRYCAAGTPVQFDVIPGVDHAGAMFPGTMNAVRYLADRFAGLPAPSNCH